MKIPFPNNMGVVRYVLAFAVVFAHYNELTGARIPFPLTSYEAVGGFFALSGFLIYSSYRRRPTGRGFIEARGRRLLPAYVLTVIGAAILLVFVSSLRVSEYFASAGFWKYLAANLSFLNFLQPTLPGVFDGLQVPAVNGSLWTMKVEWALYLSVPLVFGIISRVHGRAARWIAGLIAFAIGYRLVFRYLYVQTESEVFEILGRQFMGQFAYFYTGALCYHLLPYFLRYKWWVMAAAGAMTVCSPAIPYYHIAVQPIVWSVIVIWVSIVGRWGTWEGKHDNISYNIYLCHFPLIQTYVWLGSMPNEWGGLAACCAVTVVFAYIILLGERFIRNFLLSLGDRRHEASKSQ